MEETNARGRLRVWNTCCMAGAERPLKRAAVCLRVATADERSRAGGRHETTSSANSAQISRTPAWSIIASLIVCVPPCVRRASSAGYAGSLGHLPIDDSTTTLRVPLNRAMNPIGAPCVVVGKDRVYYPHGDEEVSYTAFAASACITRQWDRQTNYSTCAHYGLPGQP